MKPNGAKVNYKKLINACDIPFSCFTVARYLKQQGMMYKKIRKRLPMNLLDKVKRCDLAKKWLSGNNPCKCTIVSDEMWFSFNGSDDWILYVQKSEFIYRPRHQKKGVNIMVWAMVLPNSLLSYKILCRDVKSPTYIDLLRDIHMYIKLWE